MQVFEQKSDDFLLFYGNISMSKIFCLVFLVPGLHFISILFFAVTLLTLLALSSQNVRIDVDFYVLTITLTHSPADEAIKKIESVKTVKSVMSFFCLPFIFFRTLCFFFYGVHAEC